MPESVAALLYDYPGAVREDQAQKGNEATKLRVGFAARHVESALNGILPSMVWISR